MQFVDITRNNYTFKVRDEYPARTSDGFFWDAFTTSWEPFTLDWIEKNSDVNGAFLDIGGWIGPTSLWASNFFKRVHCFEPDPIAFESLAYNVALNSDNINIYKFAITARGESVPIFSRSGLGSSMTSMYTGEATDHVVSGLSFADTVKLDNFSLIKIDIEGGERLIIDSITEAMELNPVNMIFSFHYNFYSNPQEDFDYIINKLKEVYSKFITEDGSEVDVGEILPGFGTVFCSN